MNPPSARLDACAAPAMVTVAMEPIDVLEQRLRDGDEAALAALWDLHRERLARLARFRSDVRMARRSDADDVLQEAYLAARQRLARFAADGFRSSFVWLRLVVVQTLTDLHRHHLGAQLRDAGREQAMDAGHGGGGSDPSAALAARLSGGGMTPSGIMVAAERRALVRTAVATLGEADREILALRHGEQLGNGEVAEILGIQEKAASIRYVRALRRLKDALTRGGGLTSEVGHAAR